MRLGKIGVRLGLVARNLVARNLVARKIARTYPVKNKIA